MVNCKRVQDVLSDYIEGSLYGEDLHQIEDHVQSCPTCRILYERIHGTIRLLGSLTEISTTDSFDLRLREKIRKWRKSIGAQEMTINPNYDPEKADWRFLDRKD